MRLVCECGGDYFWHVLRVNIDGSDEMEDVRNEQLEPLNPRTVECVSCGAWYSYKQLTRRYELREMHGRRHR